MLYLEDYLEMIENLPMEMRERLTEMRETDLQVQNTLDSLDEQVKSFFKKCTQPNVKPEWKDEQFKKIKDEYEKAVNDADEKVQLANHIHELVDRYTRRLDQELSKFKMELEADNAGITEMLEKRSLELDKPPAPQVPQRAEKRRAPHSTASLHNHTDKRPTTTEVLSNLAQEVARESLGAIASSSASNSPALKMFSSGSNSSLSYSLGHIGAGSNAAIAAAASQAIAATQQMQQGRRTSSMKASYEIMSKNIPKELSLALGAPSTPTTPEAMTSASSSAPRSQRTKKQTSKAAALAQQQQSTTAQQQAAAAQQAAVAAAAVAQQTVVIPNVVVEGMDDQGGELQVDDWQPDPNEPRYCLCNQVSYGDMVGCDNEDCPIEWFHYGCVGLTQAPKGKWFCPQCTAAMKRRGRR
ncbi:inhibitor of growth protein 3-like [Littorina saxatilis]|uniref:Inhibitor of growth protein n=1 Tax=Littorina saxatilis TaxID=31220 RepID=A0AAN9BCU7_9CAEN